MAILSSTFATVWGLAKVAIFITNVDAENCTLINHKCVCGALNRHFCKTRVIGSVFFFRPVCQSVVRWICKLFDKALVVALEKNSNVLPKALAYVSLNNCPSVNNFVKSVGLTFVKSDLNLTADTLSGILILSTFDIS